MYKLNLLTACLCILLISSCKNEKHQDAKPDFLAADIDTTVSPGEDFFLYANGGWIKKNPIPDDESGWGVGYLVTEDIYIRLRKINEDAATKNAGDGTTEQKISDFWKAGMDTAAIEKQGLSPLQPLFDRIDGIKTIEDLMNVAASLHKMRLNVFFRDGVMQDDKRSDLMAYQLNQGGLGMPDRDYYFETDARTVGVRKSYLAYIEKTLNQLGNDSATASKKARSVLDLETRLAKASRTLEGLRDPLKNYNKLSIDQLNKLAPNLNWSTYLQNIGVSKIDSVIVGQPEFYSALNKELSSTPLSDWQNYLKVYFVRVNAQYLNAMTYDNYFTYVQTLSGAKKQRPRWKRVLDAEETAMGEALGQLFVKEYFNANTKKRYVDLVESIRDAYKDRINNLSWMDQDTKQKALEKLSKIIPKVGYPDQWKDFSALKISTDAYVLNMQRANAWWHDFQFSKLGKPVDRNEWDISPQTYNAYYNPSNNEIVLPAGIFAVPGIRDEDLDDAFVFGYAGASTIGHEITHGFDDQGRQYDSKGNLTNWWSLKDSTEFVRRANAIIKQFNEYNPVDTIHVNGDATQGENIADLGGLLLGLDAFKKTAAFKENKKIGGLTPLQRYFLGYAYGWLYQAKEESLARQLMSDVHAPAKERVNGPVVNIPEFYEAFGVKNDGKMFRQDSLRVRIW